MSEVLTLILIYFALEGIYYMVKEFYKTYKKLK